MTNKTLIDPFLRPITYLRLSVTDRCDFRCTYCMSENMTFLPKKELLTLEELDRLASTFIELGVRKLRITGGEPLVRRDLMSLFERLHRHKQSGAVDEISLTTNGSQLEKYAKDLKKFGVERINVSLDTLNPEKFMRITRRGILSQVLAGIEAAKSVGMRVKINTVALQNFNDDEFETIIEWCAKEDMDLTFIEVMPMGDDFEDIERVGSYYSLLALRERLNRVYTLNDIPLRTGGPARYVERADNGQKIGFITPLSHNFCESCNRVRITCTGEIYTCLGQEGKMDLRTPLRASDDQAYLEKAIRQAIATKPRGHDFDYSRQKAEGTITRHMSHTGG